MVVPGWAVIVSVKFAGETGPPVATAKQGSGDPATRLLIDADSTAPITTATARSIKDAGDIDDITNNDDDDGHDKDDDDYSAVMVKMLVQIKDNYGEWC
ncbi:hypothetical protein DPMN_066490 [Dreissena polymorpha]|uniref:Uncharacterized protein n=1 Tax=Dreissena polymorpha TaxID=45954 RepID=A0A9D3YWE8_DREPO|nr:hypothetical protein DPMN_066490 [Dreissena polymorpha]